VARPKRCGAGRTRPGRRLAPRLLAVVGLLALRVASGDPTAPTESPDVTVERYVAVLEAVTTTEDLAARDARMTAAGLAASDVAAIDAIVVELRAATGSTANEPGPFDGMTADRLRDAMAGGSGVRRPGAALFATIDQTYTFSTFAMLRLHWSAETRRVLDEIDARSRLRAYPTEEAEAIAKLRLFVTSPEVSEKMINVAAAEKLLRALEGGATLATLESTPEAASLRAGTVLENFAEDLARAMGKVVARASEPPSATPPPPRSTLDVATAKRRAAVRSRLPRIEAAFARGAPPPRGAEASRTDGWKEAFESADHEAVADRLRRRKLELSMQRFMDPDRFEAAMSSLVPHVVAWLRRARPEARFDPLRVDERPDESGELVDVSWELLELGGSAACEALVGLLSEAPLRAKSAETLAELASDVRDEGAFDGGFLDDADALRSPGVVTAMRAAPRRRAALATLVPGLVEAIRAHPDVRVRLVGVLGDAGVGGERASAVVEELGRSPSADERTAAYAAAATVLDPERAPAFLEERLRAEPDDDARTAAADGLWRCGAPGFRHVRATFASLNPAARIAVLKALREGLPGLVLEPTAGGDTREAVEKDPDAEREHDRSRADRPTGAAIARLPRLELVAFVRSVWGEAPGPRVRGLSLACLTALRGLGLDDLDRVLADLGVPSESLRAAAVDAIAALGPEAKRAGPALVAALEGAAPTADGDSDALVNLGVSFQLPSTIVEALERLGPETWTVAEPRLREIAARKSWSSFGVSMALQMRDVTRRMEETFPTPRPPGTPAPAPRGR